MRPTRIAMPTMLNSGNVGILFLTRLKNMKQKIRIEFVAVLYSVAVICLLFAEFARAAGCGNLEQALLYGGFIMAAIVLVMVLILILQQETS